MYLVYYQKRRRVAQQSLHTACTAEQQIFRSDYTTAHLELVGIGGHAGVRAPEGCLPGMGDYSRLTIPCTTARSTPLMHSRLATQNICAHVSRTEAGASS